MSNWVQMLLGRKHFMATKNLIYLQSVRCVALTNVYVIHFKIAKYFQFDSGNIHFDLKHLSSQLL